MRFRTTLLLVAVCVVLGGYVVWSGRATNAASGTPTPTLAPSVTAFSSGDVDMISVRDNQGQTVTATRSGTSWTLTAPSSAPADGATIGGEIAVLAHLSATDVVTPTSDDLAPYGLAPPRYTVTMSKGATVLTELHVGDKNPNASATYVQPSGSKVIYLMNDPAVETVIGWLTAPPVQPTPLPTSPPPASTATATAK